VALTAQEGQARMSGLIRGMIDQVLKNMGEDERKESVNYVTDRMVERMNNEERVVLLMMILDRVMSNLSDGEKADLAERVAARLQESSGEAKAGASEAEVGADIGVGQPGATNPSA
jgi:DNA polymerase elongation subunit (family B)